jgi:drug/metabolite transporter (DMT)-like permease
MTSVNKQVAVLKFPAPNGLLLVESVMTALALQLLSGVGILSLGSFSGGVWRWLPLVTLAKAGNMYFSFLTMAHTSLPVYNVLKRLNPVFSLVLDFAVRRSIPTAGVLLGVFLIAAGAVVTSQGDLEFEPFGYTVAIIAAMCQALYLVLAKKAQDVVQVSQWDLLYFTAVFNCCIFAPLSSHEVEPLQAFWAKQADPTIIVAMLAGYVVLGGSLNYVTFWGTTTNSPTTVGVAGNFKGVLSTVAGLIQGAKLTSVGLSGLALSASGGCVYTFAKMQKSGKPDKKKD